MGQKPDHADVKPFWCSRSSSKGPVLCTERHSHGRESEQIETEIREDGSIVFRFTVACNALAIVTGRAIVTRLALKVAPDVPWLEKTDYSLRKMQGKSSMKSKFPYQEKHDKYIRISMPKIVMVEGEGERPATV